MKTNKPLSYYVYEMPKVTILWNGILQPIGMFKSAEIAANELKRIGAHLPDYSLNCDGTILNLSEYL